MCVHVYKHECVHVNTHNKHKLKKQGQHWDCHIMFVLDSWDVYFMKNIARNNLKPYEVLSAGILSSSFSYIFLLCSSKHTQIKEN